MFHADLKLSATFVPAGTSFSPRRSMSRLWPLVGGQPKSLPAADHHRGVPDGTLSGVMFWRLGSLGTEASQVWTPATCSEYGVPSADCQSMRWVSTCESCQPLTGVRLP